MDSAFGDRTPRFVSGTPAPRCLHNIAACITQDEVIFHSARIQTIATAHVVHIWKMAIRQQR